MSNRASIGFSVYISLPTQIEAVPQRRNIANSFDYHGDLVTLQRLPDESNVEYKNRQWDASVHPGSPTYLGATNSLARDLGMLRVPAIRIDVKTGSSGDVIAVSPRVDVLANRVVLYSDWRPNGTAVIDREIRTYQLGDTGYHLDDLAAAINQSIYFSAVLLESIRPNTISSTLVRMTSDLIIQEDGVHADKFIDLTYGYIARNSLYFSEVNIFQTETTVDPTATGEYSVDHTEGTILAYGLPSGDGVCSYHTGRFPLDVDAVPIQLFSFQDDDFQDELFQKQTLESGEEINSLLNAEGSEIYHQLFLETEVFWGE